MFRVVDVPLMRYLIVDGHGDPDTSVVYAGALRVLYPVAYAVRFASKQQVGRDYVVPPLEGLWWADDMDAFTSARDMARWDWIMMVLARLHHDYILAQGRRMVGKHHEIYLSDPRRAAPEKLHTILRQPVADTIKPGQ